MHILDCFIFSFCFFLNPNEILSFHAMVSLMVENKKEAFKSLTINFDRKHYSKYYWKKAFYDY